MRGIMEVPPTSLVLPNDWWEGEYADERIPRNCVDAYLRNKWRPNVFRDTVITEHAFVMAAITVGLLTIEVIQIHEGAADDFEDAQEYAVPASA
jgi:hypothetical protein